MPENYSRCCYLNFVEKRLGYADLIPPCKASKMIKSHLFNVPGRELVTEKKEGGGRKRV